MPLVHLWIALKMNMDMILKLSILSSWLLHHKDCRPIMRRYYLQRRLSDRVQSVETLIWIQRVAIEIIKQLSQVKSRE